MREHFKRTGVVRAVVEPSPHGKIGGPLPIEVRPLRLDDLAAPGEDLWECLLPHRRFVVDLELFLKLGGTHAPLGCGLPLIRAFTRVCCVVEATYSEAIPVIAFNRESLRLMEGSGHS